MIHHNASTEGDRISISCHSEFEASPLYLMMWLAQSQRIMSQIKSKCTEYVTALGMQTKSGESDSVMRYAD